MTNQSRIELIIEDQLRLLQYTLEDTDHIFSLIDRNREHLSQHEEPTARKYQEKETVYESIANPKNPLRLRFGIWDGDIFVGGINLEPDEEKASAKQTFCRTRIRPPITLSVI